MIAEIMRPINFIMHKRTRSILIINRNNFTQQFKNVTIVKLLLENKANKLLLDKEGKTAFEYAVFAGNEEIINLLK